jgi:hypothetical protein
MIEPKRSLQPKRKHVRLVMNDGKVVMLPDVVTISTAGCGFVSVNRADALSEVYLNVRDILVQTKG